MKDKIDIRDLFDRIAGEYAGFGNEYFGIFAERLIQRAKPFCGAHILDVATGNGVLLKRALKDVGSTGLGYGIDISSKMIKRATEEIRARNAILKCMDAETLDFPEGSFDIVYCAFGLFFFPDRSSVMRAFHRVLKPRGTAAVSTWGEIGQTRKILKQKLVEKGIDPIVTAHPMPTPEELKKLFNEAGFTSIEIVSDQLDHVYVNFEHWWSCLWKHATRSALEKLNAEQLEFLKEELSVELADFNCSDGFHELFHVYYTIAKK